MSCFLLVVTVWVFSVCLHEYGHAWAAFRGGDYTVREKGYLSMNPIRYAHPVTSFLLPMLFLAMGGIGLPGGAVYIEKHRLRSREWETWVSLAGPAMNLVLAIVIGFLLHWVFLPYWPTHAVTYGMAFLLQLEISAILFNLIPVPPLDGFQALEPWLPGEWKNRLAPLWNNGMLILFLIFWYVRPVNHAFWAVVYIGSEFLGIPRELGMNGLINFQEDVHRLTHFQFWGNE